MSTPEAIHHLRTGIRHALVAVCVAATALMAATTPASAQDGRFACDPGFYQVISGQLSEFDPATGTYVGLGAQQASYNAMAYRIADGYMYAVRGTTLLRINNGGGVTELGTIPALDGAYTGDFGDDGLLHVSRGGAGWVKVNVDTLEAIPVPELDSGVGVADIANVNGKFYGVSGSGTLFIFDPIGLTVTNGGAVSGLSSSGAFGAAWSTAGGNLYVGRNAGFLFQITGYSKGAPVATQVGTAQSTNSNDGSSCSLAPPPAGITDVDGAEPETQPSTPEAQAAQQNYNESSQQTYTFDDAGLGTGASCPTAENVDRLPRAAVDPIGVLAPTSMYSSSFGADDGQWKLLSGMWTVADGAFQQMNDCGYDYTALLNAPALESFAFVADFGPLDGVNHGGLVINQSSPDTRSGAMLVDLSDGGTQLRWGTYDDRGYYQFMGSAPVDGTGAVRLGVTVHGTSVTIEFNGQAIAKAESTYSGGYVGLVASKARVAFDQVDLTALPAQ